MESIEKYQIYRKRKQNNLKICFLLTHVPDPKTNKRIKVFSNYGEVCVICTRRKSQDIWEPAFKDIKHYIFDIDLPSSNQILKRMLVSKEYQKRALTILNRVRPEIIYADGLDSLLIVSKYKARFKTLQVFYDVADLRESYLETPTNIIKRFVVLAIQKAEKKAFTNVDYLVITSPKFYSEHYKKLIHSNKVLFIPNAPETKIFETYKRKNDGIFTVGFIGGIRYINQMKMLVDAAENVKCRVLFAGAGGTNSDYQEILEYCRNKDFVSFTGKYDYEKEIARLYGSIDCVYAVYDADNPNVRIALPNKLYESILCELPIIVAKNTYLSELVESWGVGVSVGHQNLNELADVLKKLKDDKNFYESIVCECKKHRNNSDFSKFVTKIEKAIGL